MDLADLDSLFKEAAETERRMPPALRKAKQATWPDYVKDWMGYGWTQQGETVLKPTAKQIDNLDYALGLGLTMPEDDRRLIWAVCHSAAFKQRGASWTKLARMLGLHDPRRVKQAYKDAMIRLYYQLN